MLLVAVNATAQAPHFQVCKFKEVYPNAKVEVMYEDRAGAMWIGANKGLFLFDGLEFSIFSHADTSSQKVTAIYQDHNMRLWLGYEDGNIYYLKGRQLEKWEPEEGTPAKPITGFVEDRAGRLWFSTYGEGVYFVEKGRMYNFNAEDGLTGNEIYAITADLHGRIWVGTDGGISICSMVNGKKRVEKLTRQDGLRDEIVHELLADHDGNIWIGTYDRGFCKYLLKERRFEHPLENWQQGIINCFAVFDDKELWIGTEGNGIWRFDFQTGLLRPLNDHLNLNKARVIDLLKDIEGNIWIANQTNGLCYANRQFEFMELDLDNIQAVVTDPSDRLWIGTTSGLYSVDLKNANPGQLSAHFLQLKLNVVSLYLDEFGRVWVGTFENGAYLFDPKTLRMRHLTEKDGLANNNVLSIAGANHQIWLATLGGVSQLKNTAGLLTGKPSEFTNLTKADGLGTNFIYKVFIDSKKRAWFATDGQGISVLDNGNIQNYRSIGAQNTTDNESIKAVYSIAEDHQGNIWFSTATGGVYKFDGQRFKRLSLKEGSRDLSVTSLSTDANGMIVIVHASGVNLLNPTTEHLIYYDEELGLDEIDPNLNSHCTDRWGAVWMGVKGGILKYTPLNEQLEIHPRSRLETVSVSLKPIDFLNDTLFKHDENNFAFNYIGLWYTHPTSVRYRYKLSGYDKDWIASKDRAANYSQLPPGKYEFMFMSTENEAWSDEPVVKWAFEIMPPIWRRWWFVTLVLGLVAGLFYWYIKIRDKRQQRELLLEKESVENELAVIKAQINPHFLFNSFNTLIAVIEDDPKTAVEYVEKLSDFYRSMLQLRDKEVISLDEEAELVQHFGYLLEKRYGNNFRLNIDLRHKQGHIVPLSLQILVENAVKHNVISKSKPLQVDITSEENGYISVVNNLQPKVHPEASTRFGLESLKRRYELLFGKSVKVEKTLTYFKVCIPVIH